METVVSCLLHLCFSCRTLWGHVCSYSSCMKNFNKCSMWAAYWKLQWGECYFLWVVLIINFCLSAFFPNWDRGGGILLYHLRLSITLLPSVCRSKASEIGVPKMYIVKMTGRQCRGRAWSIRHVSPQKGEGGEAEKGLGVDLIPQLEEFEAFSCGQVGFSSAFFQLASVIHVCGGGRVGVSAEHGRQQGMSGSKFDIVDAVIFVEARDLALISIWKSMHRET